MLKPPPILNFNACKTSRSCALSAILAVLGCGDRSDLAPVSGVITLDGQPVEGAYVSFVPAEGDGASYAITTTDGSYALVQVDDDESGAAVGRNAVRVTKVQTTYASGAPDVPLSASSLLPAQAADGSLTVKVPASGLKDVNFDFQSE